VRKRDFITLFSGRNGIWDGWRLVGEGRPRI
jgi:hypothetical protein